ncbi:unnamed protein product [Moneuplotes crassus]|uniref:Uncharacterized protein n=1 Tax=Euplotes crassus TaxID=5936 RepID=A0AAD1XRF1_EUPCR|nr:unnamed protein product [Moneuplotes crassus]
MICLFGGMIFHIVGIVWIAEEDCTDTDWYKLALANTIIFFVFFGLIFIGALICFFIGFSKSKPKRVKPQIKDENVEEKENKEGENKDNDTKDRNQKEKENKDKNENKDEEEDLEEEEIY